MELAEVTVRSVVPTVTVTATSGSEPVSPEIVNPAPCSAMFTVSSPAMGSRRSGTRVWSLAATAGNVIETTTGFSAVSVTVTLAVLEPELAVSGVPRITPVVRLMRSPGGSPVALYEAMSRPPAGLMAAMASPTLSEAGAV